MHEPPSISRIYILTGIALAGALLTIQRVGDLIDIHIGGISSRAVAEGVGFVLMVACIAYCNTLLRRFHAAVVRTSHVFKETLTTSIEAVDSERKLQQYLDLAPDSFITLNARGIIVSINKRCCELFGMSAEQLLNRSMNDIVTRSMLVEQNRESTEFFDQVYCAQPGTCISFTGTRPNGEVYYADTSASSFEVYGELIVVCVVRDVTQHTLLRLQLEQSRKNLFAILENSAEFLWSTDTQHRLVIFNKVFETEFEEFTGVRPQVGMIHYKYFDHEVQDFWEKVTNSVLEGNNQRFYRQYNVGGKTRYIQTDLRPIWYSGEIVGVSGAVNNITDLKEAEMKLEKSLERYEIVSKATNEIIWDWNIPKARMYWGANYEKLFGYSLDAEDTDSGSWVERIHLDDRERIIEEVSAALLDPQRQYWEAEYKYIKADGSAVSVRDKAYIVRDEKGQALNMIGAMDDVTEELAIRQKLMDFNKELELKVIERTRALDEALSSERELNGLKTRFMSMVSHEFRTPLTVILSSTQLLSKYYDRLKEDQRQEYFRVIHNEINHLVSMLNDVLTLGTSGSGRVQFNPQSTSLDSFMTSLLSRMNSINTQSQRIEIRNEWKQGTAVFDEALINHVMSNIIGNAMKYSAPESVIRVICDELDGELRIRCIDQGIGIPEADKQHLFQPFHRADNVGVIQGTGLGLAIVREFVELHRGSVTIDSVQDQGTTVCILLPQTSPHGALPESAHRDTPGLIHSTQPRVVSPSSTAAPRSYTYGGVKVARGSSLSDEGMV